MILKDSMKQLVKELQRVNDCDLLQDTSIEELLASKKLALIRSAKPAVAEKFMDLLNEQRYNGTLHMIGRNEDKKYLDQYQNLKIALYVTPDQQRYSLANTGQYLEKLELDAICFLYQTRVHDDCVNLLKILEHMNCKRFAISNQMKASKVINLETYLAGRRLYQ